MGGAGAMVGVREGEVEGMVTSVSCDGGGERMYVCVGETYVLVFG